MIELVLILKNVFKIINYIFIVQLIFFDVRKGEIFGFLGLNGLGKIIIFRMIVQFIKKIEGVILFKGRLDSDFEYFMKYIGVIIEGLDMYLNMIVL